MEVKPQSGAAFIHESSGILQGPATEVETLLRPEAVEDVCRYRYAPAAAASDWADLVLHLVRNRAATLATHEEFPRSLAKCLSGDARVAAAAIAEAVAGRGGPVSGAAAGAGRRSRWWGSGRSATATGGRGRGEGA